MTQIKGSTWSPPAMIHANMRAEYAINGRNIGKVANKFKVTRTTVYSYLRRERWDDWADELEHRTSEQLFQEALKLNLKVFDTASLGVIKIQQAMKKIKIDSKISILQLARSLKELHSIVQLICGGPTERTEWIAGERDPQVLRQRAQELLQRAVTVVPEEIPSADVGNRMLEGSRKVPGSS